MNESENQRISSKLFEPKRTCYLSRISNVQLFTKHRLNPSYVPGSGLGVRAPAKMRPIEPSYPRRACSRPKRYIDCLIRSKLISIIVIALKRDVSVYGRGTVGGKTSKGSNN